MGAQKPVDVARVVRIVIVQRRLCDVIRGAAAANGRRPRVAHQWCDVFFFLGVDVPSFFFLFFFCLLHNEISHNLPLLSPSNPLR